MKERERETLHSSVFCHFMLSSMLKGWLTSDSLKVTVEKKTRAKLKSALYFEGHPFQSVLNRLGGSCSEHAVIPAVFC